MTQMNDRLALFMRSEQLTAAKLAEIVQVQPSSISHLLSGRNKPNFEFVSRLMRMFPELNPDWLINGIGAMYRHQNEPHPHKEVQETRPPESVRNLFENERQYANNQSIPSELSFDTNVKASPHSSSSPMGFGAIVPDPSKETEATAVEAALPEPAQPAGEPVGTLSATQGPPAGVRQVVVLFDDQTCMVYQTRPTTER